jgi:hypothetical protein
MTHNSAGNRIAIHENITNSRLLLLENSGRGVEGEDEAIFLEAVFHFLSGLVEK